MRKVRRLGGDANGLSIEIDDNDDDGSSLLLLLFNAVGLKRLRGEGDVIVLEVMIGVDLDCVGGSVVVVALAAAVKDTLDEGGIDCCCC